MKLTDTQILVLKLARSGRRLTAGAFGMSEHGGRARSISSLQRRKLLDVDQQITQAGREALAENS